MDRSKQLVEQAYNNPLSRKRVLHTDVEFYSVHIPIQCNEYGDVIGSVSADTQETMEGLQVIGFENVITFSGPTGARFVAVEASEHNRQIINSIMSTGDIDDYFYGYPRD